MAAELMLGTAETGAEIGKAEASSVHVVVEVCAETKADAVKAMLSIRLMKVCILEGV